MKRMLSVSVLAFVVGCGGSTGFQKSPIETPTPTPMITPTPAAVITITAEWLAREDFDLHLRNDAEGSTFSLDPMVPWDCTYRTSPTSWGCTHSGDVTGVAYPQPAIETITLGVTTAGTWTIGVDHFGGDNGGYLTLTVSSGSTAIFTRNGAFPIGTMWLVGQYRWPENDFTLDDSEVAFP